MSVSDDIISLLQLKASLLVKRDSSKLLEVLDPRFVYINARGQRFDREGYVNAFCGPEGIRFHSQSFDDVQIQDFGTFVVATMNVHDTLEYEGEMHSGLLRSLCVFSQAEAEWRWSAGQTMTVTT